MREEGAGGKKRERLSGAAIHSEEEKLSKTSPVGSFLTRS